MEDLNTTGRMHKIIMTNRRTCTVNGVNDVLSFRSAGDSAGDGTGDADLSAEMNCYVNRLTPDKGEVDIDGRIDSFVYPDTAASGRSRSHFSPGCSVNE